jgi:hypothetical protein
MIDRQKLLTEIKFRLFVRQLLEKRDSKDNFKEKLQEEVKFRKFVRTVLTKEKLSESKTKIIPYDSTGIAILADVIKKVIPIIKDDYFSLTTDIQQRKSFRGHIINAIRNSLAPIRNIQGYEVDSSGGAGQLLSPPDMVHPKHNYAQSGDGATGPVDTGQMSEGAMDDLDQDGIPDSDDRFIDVGDKPSKKLKSSEEEDTFSIKGEDGTGRNLALLTYRRVEKVVIDGYQTLDRKEDQEDFYDYIIANFKIYFDRWEEELQKELH